MRKLLLATLAVLLLAGCSSSVSQYNSEDGKYSFEKVEGEGSKVAIKDDKGLVFGWLSEGNLNDFTQRLNSMEGTLLANEDLSAQDTFKNETLGDSIRYIVSEDQGNGYQYYVLFKGDPSILIELKGENLSEEGVVEVIRGIEKK